MQPTKANIEAGPLKFQFEGDDEAVTRKIEQVQPLILQWLASTPKTVTSFPKAEAETSTNAVPPIVEKASDEPTSTDPSLTKVFKNGKGISLYTRPTPEKAFLLILYGYKTLLNQDVVGAAQLAKSFTETGVTGYSRLSRVADPLQKAGMIDVGGQKKGTRYLLTNAGAIEAEKILAEIKSKL